VNRPRPSRPSLAAPGRGSKSKPRPAAQTLRIIAGQWRRRRIHFPAIEGLRPTGDRVRETLFNWLGQTLGGRTCLDLFAGSGAMGFEALSRGAVAVTLVDMQAAVVRQLRLTAEELGADALPGVKMMIHQSDALSYLKRNATRFDIIFLDPPFELDLWEDLLQRLPDHLADGGWVYVEARQQPAALTPPPPGWHIIRSAKAGAVWFALLQRDNSSSPDPEPT
jgi:16S rRNA (guanine966-N2)-methyltransferase